MFLRYRVYPLSAKLQFLNTFLLILDIFVSMSIFVGVLFVLGNTGEHSILQIIISAGVGIIFFVVVHLFIDSYTDKKYELISAEYEKIVGQLIMEDPQDIKDKLLTYPAHITLKRVPTFMAWAVGIKYTINGKTYKLRNGESVEITTAYALNTLESKWLNDSKILYLTLKDNERITIDVVPNVLKNIKRSL